MKNLTISMMCIICVIFLAVFGIHLTSFSKDIREVTREQIDEWMIQAGEAYAQEEYARAIELYTKAADHGNAWGQNNLAWIRATFKDGQFRHGKLAVQYALKATEQEPQNGFFFRTLAAAYARDEQFERAIEIQKKAIGLLSENTSFTEEMKEEFQQDHQEKLAIYENHQAYVDDK